MMQDIFSGLTRVPASATERQLRWSGRTACQPILVALMLIAAVPALRGADPATPPPSTSASNALPAAVAVPGGRQMNRYQWFARTAAVPALEVRSTLRVGDQPAIDLGAPAPLTDEQTASLAKVLAVPAGVVAKTFARLTNQPPPEPRQFAQQLRTAVIDYKFLTEEWTRYQPPGDQQSVKAKALELLQAGEIAKVWDLYDALPRPQAPAAPANVRIVGP